MTSGLDLVRWELLYESFDLQYKILSYRFYCFVKASVDFTVTFRPLVELSFQGIEVNKPVIE
jgi:hypothetical protein